MVEKELFQKAEGVGIKASELKELLRVLLEKERVTTKEIAQNLGLPRSVLKLLKPVFTDFLEKNPYFWILSKKGKSLAKQTIKEEKESFDVQIIVNLLEKYQSSRPKPRRNFDQFLATFQTVAKRAILLQEKEDLENKKLFFLGDSDLTSVGGAILGGAKEIAVADIDRRVLDFIKRIAGEQKLKINCLFYDVRNKLPTKYCHYFDVVFFDPPYTQNGLKVFLSRGIAALKKKEGRIYLCYGYSRRSKERGLAVQRVLTQAGVLIQEKFLDFNQYLRAESIGSRSSLYTCELTPQSKPLIKGEFFQPIYTGAER